MLYFAIFAKKIEPALDFVLSLFIKALKLQYTQIDGYNQKAYKIKSQYQDIFTVYVFVYLYISVT